MQTQTPIRQLPFNQFKRVLQAERKEDTKRHARYAGFALAEVLAAKKQSFETLDKHQIEILRKKYAVAPTALTEFVAGVKEAFPMEMSWQYAHTKAEAA